MNQLNSLMTEKVLITILENKDKALNKLDVECFHVYNFIEEQFNVMHFSTMKLKTAITVRIRRY
jgi:hypothetical protein